MLYCCIRQEKVAATPEEKVRQKLIQYMLGDLKFPKHSLLLECQLSHLPHLSNVKDLPNRRFDLLCMVKGIHPQHALFPLLIVECKAVKLDQEVITQVVGYNHYVLAPFVAIANHERLVWGEQKEEGYVFKDGLPAFEELFKMASIVQKEQK